MPKSGHPIRRSSMRTPVVACVLLGLVIGCSPGHAGLGRLDPRDIRNGHTIPDEGYCDQPYVVVTKDGHWLCTLTTGRGVEGQRGQHVVATISRDKGRTWSPLIDIEPADGPEASWAMPLVTSSGRVYVFYDYNGDRIDTLRDRKGIRADMLGWYVYKYSDDNGRTWSPCRFRLPVRQTQMDRENDFGGEVQMLWGIGKPIVAGPSVFFGFSKIGKYLVDRSEGWFFRSDNLLTEPDPSRHTWTMLPDGDIGLRAPRGPIAEEQNLVVLSDGSLYCVYRTIDGHPCHAYSRDGGRTWAAPAYATYTPGGRLIRHPRACPRLWKTTNGRYLLWYHNHGGKTFEHRNPAWVAGGVEKHGLIHWSQPEILLYDADPDVRISYPDLIEQDGRYWVTETQKTVARVHEVDRTLFEGLWSQGAVRRVADGSSFAIVPARAVASPPAEAARRKVDALHAATEALGILGEFPAPPVPDLRTGAGFTIELWLRLRDLAAGQVVLDGRGPDGRGIAVQTTADRTLRIDLCDGRFTAGWDCDDGVLFPNILHHVVIVVDGGPRIISFVVDGILCDGGTVRQYGWGRLGAALGDVNGPGTIRIAPSMRGEVHAIRIYPRYLRTSEAVGNYLAGLPDRRTLRYTSRSAAEATAWQASTRTELARLLRIDDLRGLAIPLDAKVVAEQTTRPAAGDVHTLREIEINSTPRRRIRCLVAVPASGHGPFPAVVCIHGHGGTRRSVHDAASIYKGFAAALAAEGFVTVAADVGQHEVSEQGRSLMGERLWDLMRCVDYLESLPEVDRARIGCGGLSLGGEMAMWLGAMDTRIRATVSSGFLTRMDQMEQGHCMCWKFDGLRDRVEYADIYSLIAPRALQCQNGRREPAADFTPALAAGAMDEIRVIYGDLGGLRNVELDVHDGAHEIDLPNLLAFFRRHLRAP